MSGRVVVTGEGVVSSIGAGADAFEQALYAGATGAGPSQLFGAETTTAEVRDFAPQTWLGPKGLRVLDRSARLVCVSSHMALCQAGLSQAEAEEGDPGLGLICGTMFGSLHSITSFDWSGVTEGPNLVNPMEFPNTVINSPAGHAAIKHKLRGVNSTICAGLASGLYALHYAAEFLRFGRATALLAGGVEELCEESLLGFRKMGAASANGAGRPFAPDRDGSILGDGSALWMLESEDNARARGLAPVLEVGGFGSAHDAHATSAYDVRGDGAASAIRQALDASGIGPGEVACIISGASGSRAGDLMEARALRRVFGDRLDNIPVSAPKAAFGEALGASGALCALAGGLALRRQSAPPTAGHTGEEFGLRMSNAPQPFTGTHVLINAFGCDGNNAALILNLRT
jgi:3-oxoacyl-[acyl-carrier-protein] synthase II